jgi:hypothetical protein
MVASIVINQVGKPAGVPGVSREDLSLDVPVVLTNGHNSGVVAWNWRLMSKPDGSLAGLNTPTASSASFIPDAYGSYLIELLVNGRTRTTAIAAVKTSFLALRLPAKGETNELGGWAKALNASTQQMETGVEEEGGGGGGHHHITHENGGTDQINVGGLDGYLARPQNSDRLQGRSVSGSAPSDGDSLVWSTSLNRWRGVQPAPGGAAGGDLSGTYPLPTVAKIQNRSVDSGVPVDAYGLVWNLSGNRWQSGKPVPGGTAGGDLSGTYPLPTVAKIQGRSVDSSVPDDGYVLTWNQSLARWKPQPPTGGSGSNDRFLVFSDDSQFSEAGSSFVTKKTFRIVRDSDQPPTSWRFVVSLWVSGGGNTAECRIQAVGSGGTDSVTLSTSGVSETIVSGEIDISGTNEPVDSLITINVQLRLASGSGIAYVQYTDMFAVV